ncbi:hypothetical protein D3C76_1655660 [compost metagenome]
MISAPNETDQFAILFDVIRRLDGCRPIVGPEINDDHFRIKGIHGFLIEIRTDGFHKIIRHAAFFGTAEILVAARTGSADD